MNSQHFRYWMARLRPIARPQAWMPLLGAGMVSSFVWVAYQSPESLSFTGAAGGSEESAAIGADIDSVSVLMQEMGDRPVDDGEPDGKTDGRKTGAQTGVQTDGKPQATLLKPDAMAEGDRGNNSLAQLVKFTPDGGLANNFLPNNLSNDPMSIGGMSSSAGLNSAPSQNPLFTRNDGLAARINPLAQAIDRMNAQPYGNQTYGNQNGLNPVDNRGGVPIEGTGAIGASPVWSGIPVNGTSPLTTSAPPMYPPMSSGTGRSGSYPGSYDNNAYNTLTGAPSGVALPDPGIATPIAPIGMPIGVPIVPSAGLNSGMVTPFPVNPAETVNVPSEQVFSAPRPVPGRIIGGGTINTFSNP